MLAYNQWTKLDPASNYGPSVTIFAPGGGAGMNVVPNPTTYPALAHHNGTSAAAPYVAGVAAAMFALEPTAPNPDVSRADYVADLLLSTADVTYPYGTPDVSASIIEPMLAIAAAAGGYHIAPDLGVTAAVDGIHYNQPFTFTASAVDIKDGALGGAQVVWTSDVDGALGTGASLTYDFTSAAAGTRNITVTATNSSGIAAAVTFPFLIVSADPTPAIVWPAAGARVPAGTYWLTGRAFETGTFSALPCADLTFNGAVVAEDVPGDTTGLCRARWTWTAADEGRVSVTLAATDDLGRSGATAETLRVTASKTSVQLETPLANQGYRILLGNSDQVALAGSIVDLPRGATTTVRWYAYKPGQGPGAATLVGTTLDATWTPEHSGACATLGTTSYWVELLVRYSYSAGGTRAHAQTSARVPVTVSCESIQ
jgi:hypothetical protein